DDVPPTRGQWEIIPKSTGHIAASTNALIKADAPAPAIKRRVTTNRPSKGNSVEIAYVAPACNATKTRDGHNASLTRRRPVRLKALSNSVSVEFGTGV